jgi:hypothetical protein
MLMSWYHGRVCTVIHPVSWKFKATSLMNPASANRILATDSVFAMYFARSQWQTPPLHKGQWEQQLALNGCGRVKWLFMVHSPEKGNTSTFSSCSSSHTSFRIFFCSYQDANFPIGSSNWQRTLAIRWSGAKGSDSFSRCWSLVTNVYDRILRSG